MGFWSGLAIGLAAGAILGFFACALLTMGAQAEEEARRLWERREMEDLRRRWEDRHRDDDGP